MQTNPTGPALRAQYDALHAVLASRVSTVHFAHAGVATVALVIVTGTALKLLLRGDADQVQLGWMAAALAGTLLTYAVVRLLLGRWRLKVELDKYAQMVALRSQLGLDDPASRIPR